jgi:hypothetical protein
MNANQRALLRDEEGFACGMLDTFNELRDWFGMTEEYAFAYARTLISQSSDPKQWQKCPSTISEYRYTRWRA